MTTFGKRGSNEGDFNWPYGVCVDKDGFVYVCDHNEFKYFDIKLYSVTIHALLY